MLELETKKEVEIKSVEARDTVARDKGVGIVVRLSCLLHDLDGLGLVDKLPLSDSITAAIKEGGNVDSDQPNTATVAIKRRFKSLEYIFIDGDTQVARFEADVKTTPRVKVVDGVATLSFKIEGTVDSLEVGALSTCIGRDNIELKTEIPVDPQQDLGL